MKVFSDFRELCADPGIDAVQMTLPVHWHSIPSADAILHGKHIYHEKPMAMSFEEAARVRAAVRKKGVVFQFGTCDAILSWKVRFDYAGRAPVVFVSDGQGMDHGVRFVGQSGWVHVARGSIRARDEKLLRDPQNKCGKMPIVLPASRDHTRNFFDAIRSGGRPISDIETAVRGDTLCQIALIAVKLGRKLQWDPQAERFAGDAEANKMLRARSMRGAWKLQEV